MNKSRVRSLSAIEATMLPGLAHLASQLTEAQASGTFPRDAAVAVIDLHRVGWTETMLADVIDNGWVALANRLGHGGHSTPRSSGNGASSLGPNSRVYLTRSGLRIARLLQEEADRDCDPESSPALLEVRPRWSAESRKLCWGPVVLKRFVQASPHQVLVLQAFEESGWPRLIDDPLPGLPYWPAVRRLRETIHNLNRARRSPLLHFGCTDKGTAIYWQLRLHPERARRLTFVGIRETCPVTEHALP